MLDFAQRVEALNHLLSTCRLYLLISICFFYLRFSVFASLHVSRFHNLSSIILIAVLRSIMEYIQYYCCRCHLEFLDFFLT
jgi:hypothetical protein